MSAVLDRIRGMVAERGIFVKDFFRDPERNNNSIKHVNHVSVYQFKQELNVKLGFRLTAEEMEVLVEKCVAQRRLPRRPALALRLPLAGSPAAVFRPLAPGTRRPSVFRASTDTPLPASSLPAPPLSPLTGT